MKSGSRMILSAFVTLLTLAALVFLPMLSTGALAAEEDAAARVETSLRVRGESTAAAVFSVAGVTVIGGAILLMSAEKKKMS